jgi:hypothetical protein
VEEHVILDFMKADRILISGLTATTLMTLFSYIVSNSKRRNFKEPELLAGLLKEVVPQQELALPAGWGTHYSMGICWASVFDLLFEKAGVERDLKNAVILGGFSGLTGMVIWGLAFKMHPNPPITDYKRFYGHLLLAHIVYTLTVTSCSKASK